MIDLFDKINLSKWIIIGAVVNIENNERIEKLKSLVRTERKITAEIIEAITEIDRLRLYLDYGHTSMFSFLTKEIGYTPASAQRRIDVARLSIEIPDLKNDLKSGAINLSQVSMMAQAVRQKQKEEPGIKVTTTMKKDLLEHIHSKDLIETEKTLSQSLDLNLQLHEKKRHQKDSSVRIELTLSEEQMNQLERVKELISHQNPNPSMAELIDFLAKSYLKAKDPIVKRVKESNVTSAPVARLRHSKDIELEDKSVESKCEKIMENKIMENKRKHIPNKVKQEIFKKDQCCQWKDLRTNRICGSKFQLQIDHKESRWRGGGNEKENLQVLCSIHNKLKYQKEISA